MPKIAKHKAPCIYALEVWLTSLLLGSFIGFLNSYWDVDFQEMRGDVLLAFIIVGLAISLPCFVLLWAAAYVVGGLRWGTRGKKLATSIISFVLCIGLFTSIIGLRSLLDGSSVIFIADYLVTLLVAVWVWRWPGWSGQREESDGQERAANPEG